MIAENRVIEIYTRISRLVKAGLLDEALAKLQEKRINVKSGEGTKKNRN